MAKEHITQIVQAPSADAAWAASRWAERYGKTRYILVTDTLANQLVLISRKEVRAFSNPNLYADKLKVYKEIRELVVGLTSKSKSKAEVVAQVMLAHGDARVDHPQLACISDVGPTPGTHWLVFGYSFS